MKISQLKLKPASSINIDESGINLNAKKILLAEQIINFFAPLFNEEIAKCKSSLEVIKKDKLELKRKIAETESRKKLVITQQQKEEKIKEIISEISFLVERDALYGQLKQLILKQIKKIDQLDLTELNGLLAELRKNKSQKTITKGE